MNCLSRSLELFRHSLSVLADNKRLFLFPVINGLLLLFIAFLIIIPISALALTGAVDLHRFMPQSPGAPAPPTASHVFAPGGILVFSHPAAYVVFAVLYLLSMFVATYMNVAFYSQILNALNGQPVSIRAGLRLANRRLKAILMWSLLASTVGLLLKMLEEKVGIIGQWIVKLLGIGWSVASIFLIPVIVREQENTNPVEALKTSGRLLGKTWGESLVGFVGIHLIGSLATIAFGLFSVFSLWLGVALENFWIPGLLVGIGFVLVVITIFLLNMANDIYKGALFIYATEGTPPGPFSAEEMDTAWKLKSGRKPMLG